jgi:hypothetical protein
MSRPAAAGGSAAGFVLSGILALAAGGAAVWFSLEAAEAEAALARTKEDYASMAKWRRPVEEMLRSRKTRSGMQESSEDLLTFLDRKARQAQIPAGLFSIARNQEQAIGSWRESSYTMTLRPASKEQPISREAVVDLLRLVESERRSVKSKNLQFAYHGNAFASAVLTFAQYSPK